MTQVVSAMVFDAYGTLFDVYSVTALAERLAPGRGTALSLHWRAKQLEYSWLVSLMDPSPAAAATADFSIVTAQALDHAVATLGLQFKDSERNALLDSYLHLDAFADAPAALAALAPRPRWILSNGSQAMLTPLVAQSPLAGELDGVLSVETAGVFKPSPRVYRLAVERLGLPTSRIAFVSSNGWDAIGAKAFGFTTFWVNRTGAPVDRHGPPPDRTITTLDQLPGAVKAWEAASR